MKLFTIEKEYMVTSILLIVEWFNNKKMVYCRTGTCTKIQTFCQLDSVIVCCI